MGEGSQVMPPLARPFAHSPIHLPGSFMDNQQRTAVVTGANRGIGLETCRQLAREGVKVILTARDEKKGQDACDTLKQESLDVLFHQLDVTDPGSINQLAGYVQEEFGRLDILVNNAAVFWDKGTAGLEVDVDTVRQTMETNVYGPVLLCQTFIPLMKRHHYGRIVNVTSGLGSLTDMGGRWLAYRMSKTALNAVTRVLADEVRGTNILINSVCPGWVKTEMGGPMAERSVAEGADSIVWLAFLPDDGPNGGLFQDRMPFPW